MFFSTKNRKCLVIIIITPVYTNKNYVNFNFMLKFDTNELYLSHVIGVSCVCVSVSYDRKKKYNYIQIDF